MSQTPFEPGCLCLRLLRLDNCQLKHSRINQGYVRSCVLLVVLTPFDMRVVPVNNTLADDRAAVPDVAEGEERGSGKGLEVDWCMTEELRGPALGEGGFWSWILENRSELPIAAGLVGDLESA